VYYTSSDNAIDENVVCIVASSRRNKLDIRYKAPLLDDGEKSLHRLRGMHVE